MRKITVYKNVFDREVSIESTFDTYLDNPKHLFDELEQDYSVLAKIPQIKDKEERNSYKRAYLPAVDLSEAGILAIDIDGIHDKPEVKAKVIEKLMAVKSCYVVKESVSGNIVAFFKYKCTVEDYPFLYYKIYLELTMLLELNIDFLPEIGRLRYIGNAEILHLNNDSEVLSKILKVDRLPVINTVQPKPKKGKRSKVIYGSR